MNRLLKIAKTQLNACQTVNESKTHQYKQTNRQTDKQSMNQKHTNCTQGGITNANQRGRENKLLMFSISAFAPKKSQ
jgi:hypothetical protein